MTNQDILRIAMQQSAEDCGCRVEDFLLNENVVRPFKLGENARKYYKEPIICDFISYGNSVVASAKDEVADVALEYISKFEFYHCFETPNMHWLQERLEKMDAKVCFMAEYFLPDLEKLLDPKCAYELQVLEHDDFADLYLPQWSNAICEQRKELDVLGVGAYDDGKLVGLAACSADCEQMWQIGVDVLPEYRRQGLASTLTSTLAKEILSRGKVPFYCCAWSNLRSARNAIKSGFVPSWVQMTVKPKGVVEQINSESK